jgi:hypothetical protein
VGRPEVQNSMEGSIPQTEFVVNFLKGRLEMNGQISFKSTLMMLIYWAKI